MLDKKKKTQIIKKYQVHEGDTGSTEVQIAILTAEIDELVEHLKTHPKDHSSRRGLLRKVSSRRNLMRYLKKENAESYEVLAKKLKIRQPKLLVKPGKSADSTVDEMAVTDEEITSNDNDHISE